MLGANRRDRRLGCAVGRGYIPFRVLCTKIGATVYRIRSVRPISGH
jgi:hypothetical protein